jgi:Ca2+-transporting ATPase
MPEKREEAFDPDRMMMATVHRAGEHLVVAVKGAPEAVLAASGRIAGQDATGASPMEESLKTEWIQRAESLAADGLRVLAVAERTAEDPDEDPYEGLCFLGLVGLLDPPRDTVRQALDECRTAGIRVVMVTGDKPATAAAIAGRTGLTDEKDPQVVNGGDLVDPEQMSGEQRRAVTESTIFARVTPEQKLHLVGMMQERGQTVAMTGDGVNDAPALKKADIGVAMGRRGTDVARQAADMVLQDDAFSSIVAAVRQGRIIFGNIRQSVMFMLCTNVAEVAAVAAAAVAGGFSTLPIPLLPLQILYLNVVTDVFPALALGMGEGEPDVMRRPPRPRDESVLTRAHWRAVGGWALLLAACVLGSLAAAYYGCGFDARHAVTISFLTLAFAKLWFVFNLRSPGSSAFDNAIVRNPYVAAALALCIVLLLAAAYLPGLSDVLKTAHPTPAGWLLVIGASLVPFGVGQALRAVQRARAGSH